MNVVGKAIEKIRILNCPDHEDRVLPAIGKQYRLLDEASYALRELNH